MEILYHLYVAFEEMARLTLERRGKVVRFSLLARVLSALALQK